MAFRLEVGGGEGGTGTNQFAIVFVFMLHIKCQVPSSRGSLIITKTKGITDR